MVTIGSASDPNGSVVAASPRQRLGVEQPFESCVVDGIRIAFRQRGAGPDVVCLHAIGHGGGDFSRLAGELEGRYRITTVDWPNHGWSDDDAHPPTIARYAEILGKFLESRRLGRVVLIGNSIGGGAAIQYAFVSPDRVSALVLANPAGLIAPTPSTQAAIRLMVRFFSAGAARRWWFDPLFRLYYRMVLSRPPAHARRRLIVDARHQMVSTLARAWSGFGNSDADLRTQATRLSCPVLVTWAMRDKFLSYRLCRDVLRILPRTTVEKFDAGHSPFLETPTEFLASVERFLAKNSDATSLAVR